MFQNLGEMALLFWRTLLALPLAWRHRHKVFDQFFEIANASLLMICILSFFIGGVITLQTGPLLVERGLAGYVGGVVGYSICRELAPVMMSILIAGRVGSAMAAVGSAAAVGAAAAGAAVGAAPVVGALVGAVVVAPPQAASSAAPALVPASMRRNDRRLSGSDIC